MTDYCDRGFNCFGRYKDCGYRSARLPVKDLIPKSRLAAIGNFYTSEPAVCDGDDVYEVNLTVDNDSNYFPRSTNNQRRVLQSRSTELETWMLPDIEYTFLQFIVGSCDTFNDVENLIAYAKKNHWLGGKYILLNLDVGKTISNRQTKLVLHNNFKSQKTLNYYVSNTSKLFKKTDFILEEWPYGCRNQPLILKGNEYELAPWIRSNNKQFSFNYPQKSNKTTNSARTWFVGCPVVHDGWQQLQQRQLQLQLQQQLESSARRPIFFFSHQPITPFLANFTCRNSYSCPTRFYQRLPTSQPNLHIMHYNPINPFGSGLATTKQSFLQNRTI